MTLMRFDPFREFERIMEQNFTSGARMPRSMPMTARRRGERFFVELDVPGVRMDDVDLTVERNVVTIRARRSGDREEGDEVIVDERPYGEYSRQLFLGDNLDPDGLTAELHDGVLQLTIPVSEASKPRQIPLGSSSGSSASSTSGST
ncbi:Hsp20/alpha crystallin family protein [Actinomycetospora chibensis]|nr:Hsp20/alpha crystallin family protein [Actinomycetospora chibensis]MDD7927274.1 Hsp20/alpha crystallin family protein [Actinomycetospora chibensis]